MTAGSPPPAPPSGGGLPPARVSAACLEENHPLCPLCGCACHLNRGLAVVVGEAGEPFTLIKAQPPDGSVILLEDGSLWALSAYRINDEKEQR